MGKADMRFLNLFKGPDINEGLRTLQKTEGAVLLDVRTREEYAGAHIPGSLNIPLDELQTVQSKIPEKRTPIFVHCLSGGRSHAAAQRLKQLGYSHVTDIGGIQHYNGETEKGAAR